MKPVYFCMNRKTRRVEILTGFSDWEVVQWTFHVGFLMSDGTTADAIGRCSSLKDFCRKAQYGKHTVMVPEENPFTLEIEVNGSNCEVGVDVWRSWTGPRFLNGYRLDGERFLFGTNEVYKGKISEPEIQCNHCGSNSDCDCDPVAPIGKR